MACHHGPSLGRETNANLPEHSEGKTSPPLDCPIRELVANANRSSHTHSHSCGREPCHSGQVICHAESCVSFLVAIGFLLRRMAAAAAEQMVAALSIHLTFAVYEPKVRLMNQRRRSGRPFRLLLRQRRGGEVAKFSVDQRQELTDSNLQRWYFTSFPQSPARWRASCRPSCSRR